MGKPSNYAKMPVSCGVIVTDTHVGSHFGLCPESFVTHNGNEVSPNKFQKVIRERWRQFWDEVVPATIGSKQPYWFGHLGDSVQGRVKEESAVISLSMEDQVQAAVDVLKPHAERATAALFCCGTEAHVDKNGQLDCNVGRAVRSKRSGVNGQHASQSWWVEQDGHILHLAHHIGRTKNPGTKMGETLQQAFHDVGRWGAMLPDAILRGHAHMGGLLELPTAKGKCTVVCVGAWQCHTPFIHRIGATLKPAEIGGCIIQSDRHGLRIRNVTWPIADGMI